MKKIIAILLTLVLCSANALAIQTETNGVTVTLDGNIINFPDAKPFIDKRDRTLVPIRFVSEAMGAEVDWANDTQTVTIVKGKDTIVYKIGNLSARLNGIPYSFDTIGILKEDRTFVPLRFVAELLNCTVDWVQETMMVVITSPPPPVAFPDPQVTLHFRDNKDNAKLLWITVDNLRSYYDCENYQFKVDFINPSEFNVGEQDVGTLLGWQTYNRNQWRTLYTAATPVYDVVQIYYTTRANMETFKLYDGMPLEFVLSVKRLCSGEVREYVYKDSLKYNFPN